MYAGPIEYLNISKWQQVKQLNLIVLFVVIVI